MPHKVEIPKGSGRYYAYRKDETGKSTYVGRWTDHLKEVKFQEYFQELFTKSRPVETNVMVNTANMRFFRNNNLTDEDIDLAIDDLRELTKGALFEKYPEYEGLLDEIWISDDPAFTEVQLKSDNEILTSSYLKIEMPQTMITKVKSCRSSPDETLESVKMRFGEERKGFEDSIERQATVYYIRNCYQYPVEETEHEYVVRVPSDEKALDLEEDMKARRIELSGDVLYKGPMSPKRIRIEVQPAGGAQ